MFNLRKKDVMSENQKNILKKVILFYEKYNNIFCNFSTQSEKRQIIKRIYEILNYDSFPHIQSQLEKLNNDELKVYRGISAPNIELLKSYINDFINGDIFYGGRASIYGTGIYTVIGNDSDVAQDYASDGEINKCGVVIECAIDSNTKIIKHSEINEIRNFLYNKINKMNNEISDNFLLILEDDGALSGILGYDAIFVEDKKYLVVLNRTKMIVNDTNLFEQINYIENKHHIV